MAERACDPMAELPGSCVKEFFPRFPLTSPWLFTVLFFSNLVAGLFVMLILPHFFSAGHLGKGLFIGDSTSIHEGATRVLQAWRSRGPFASLLLEYPMMYDWLVAAVYYLFSAHPLSFLPIQAGSMALAGTLFYRLLLKLGFLSEAAVCGALWLSLNPQTFEWSTQLLKDGIFLAAILLVLSAFFSGRPGHAFFLCLAGCLVLLIVRPHWIRVLMAAMLLMALARGMWSLCGPKGGKIMVSWTSLGVCLLLPSLFYLGIKATPEPYQKILASYEAVNQEAMRSLPESAQSLGQLPSWTHFRPSWLNNPCFEVYNLRKERIRIGGRSILDEHRVLHSFPEQITYLPRALQISLFAPFPSEIWQGVKDGRKDPRLGQIRFWPQEGLGRRTTQVAREFMPWLTLFCTLALLGVALAIADSQTRSGVVWLMLFCLPQLALLAMVCPNLGTFVRLRYPFYAPLVCVGLAAWVAWWRSRDRQPGFHS